MLTREETPAAGTSLEVLAPYLPYGIEVMTPEGKGTLDGLPRASLAKRIVADVGVLGAQIPYALRDILPILRPFSALCYPLSDGTIPAVEVAKLLLAHQYDAKHHRYEAAHIGKVQCRQPGLECFQVTVAGLNDNLVVAIYNNLDLENEDRGVDSADVLNVVSYLRRCHFAVGLEPHQYIEKSPAAASPAIEGAGR